jgi:hypothetical protein
VIPRRFCCRGDCAERDLQQHRPVVERTERQEVGESFEQRIDEVDRKCQPE